MSYRVIINPGSGPVEDSTEEQAAVNVRAFAQDAGYREAPIQRVPDKDYGEGRYAFLVTTDRDHEVQMPGIPLEQMRFTGGSDQNIFDFPRLYVDGSSWVWCYGVNSLKPDEA